MDGCVYDTLYTSNATEGFPKMARLESLKNGDQVVGQYNGAAYSGRVVSKRLRETEVFEIEIDFGRSISGFRGGARNGLIITGLHYDGDFIRLTDEQA